jgi:Xaa-Pro aminopeptidase
MHPTQEKLALLRRSMKENKIDAYLIPSSDPNIGEYIPDNWKIIAWLTGFKGSAASVVVTDIFAGLWTDSRYFVQAEKELAGSGFVLMKYIPAENNDFIEWLKAKLATGDSIGLDGRIFSIGQLRKLEKSVAEKVIKIDTGCDLISGLWSDRPEQGALPAFDHSVAFCGKDRSSKIIEVRSEMERRGIDYHLLTSADDIMWLLNIRGNDIKYSPLILSFAIIGPEQILLFAEENKIPYKIAMEFDKLGIVLLPYEETAGIISDLDPEKTILISPGTTSASLFNSIPEGMKIIEGISIPARFKAVKNKVEIENIGRVMIKDGVALTKFFFWTEQYSGLVSMSELSLAEKLNQLRSEQDNFLGLSFSPIVAFNEHGALPHYSATAESDSVIGNVGILLVDSGGQYLDGTTDITRTIAVGRPTAQQKKDFTLVLKGTIALAMAVFPYGTRGSQLDILARKALWENGLNYGHGTGHGVGFCLNVHEGPQNISPNAADVKTSIESGMLISDEPAIYREGEYGIRIENLILCYENEETEFGKFLKFDTVSLCYIDKNLIDISLLDSKEIAWLNAYHSEVYEKLSPLLSDTEEYWLKEKTSRI